MDLHIGVDASLSMDMAHNVGEDVERAIKSSIPAVRDVVVHLEPRDPVTAINPIIAWIINQALG